MIFWSTTGFRMPTTPWLTTINSDGSPHVTGVGALWVDGSFRCETADGTRKGRNLARTHGACLPSPPGRALRRWNGPAHTRQRRWKTRQAPSKLSSPQASPFTPTATRRTPDGPFQQLRPQNSKSLRDRPYPLRQLPTPGRTPITALA